MAFVNEFVSDEDIKKYKLERLWLGFHPEYQSVPSVYRHTWTVDRERKAFLMVVGGGRREDYATICVLYCKGEYHDVRISKDPSGGRSSKDSPYRIIWDLVSINREKPQAKHVEIIQILKEALTIYGYNGVDHEIPDAVVEFNF